MEDIIYDEVLIQGSPLKLFGQEYLTRHPLYLEQQSYTPQWTVCNRDGVEYELYWVGCILACSKGTSHQKLLMKMVTVDQPIQQGLIASMNNEKSVCEDYIVVVSDVNLHFYSFLGQDILRALPFHGARVWALSPSLLIHKKQGLSGRSDHSSTVCLLSPLDEFTYIQLDSSSCQDNAASFLDTSYHIISIVENDDRRYIVTSYKGALVVCRLNKIDRSSVAIHSDNFTPADDIEVLKSRLGMTVFTPNSAKVSTKVLCNSTPKQQVDRERNPSSNVSSCVHTLPNITAGAGDIPAANNTLLSSTRMTSVCYLPGYNLTKIYSDKSIGTPKNVKVLVYQSYAGVKYLAVLNPIIGQLQCMVLLGDHVQTEQINIACCDVLFVPKSKFLVIMDVSGSFHLYDGTNQIGKLKRDSEIHMKPLAKKVRTRSTSGGALGAYLAIALPDAFILKDEHGNYFYYLVPSVTESPIVRSVLEALISLHNHSSNFYQLLAVILLRQSNSLDPWTGLQSALLEFIGLMKGPTHNTVTLHDPTVRRTRNSQTNEDWENMLNVMKDHVGRFGLPAMPNLAIKEVPLPPIMQNTEEKELLLKILHALHTEYHIDVHNKSTCQDVAALIHHIALSGNNAQYVYFYRTCYPHLGVPDGFQDCSPKLLSLESVLISLLTGSNLPPHQILSSDLTPLSEAVLILYLIMADKPLDSKSVEYLIPGSARIETVASVLRQSVPIHENLLQALVTLGLDLPAVLSLPDGIQLPLLESLYPAHCNPPVGLPAAAYRLIHRTDVITATTPSFMECSEVNSPTDLPLSCQILDFRFSEDRRVEEASAMFSSSSPVKIVVNRRPEMTDAEYTDQQELLLFNKTKRTMALPVGKALFTFGTLKPFARDPIPIPDICISGKALPRGNTVTLDLDIPAEMIHWSEFHSGVATGLRIDPMISEIDSQWMLYNRPQDLTNKHAGFLFALGLSGHLKKLSSRNLHDYLCQRHKFTSIGLLLGLGVTNRGTQDETTTKLFSIHVPALLPPTAVPLELDHLVQTAAVAGLGLVYIGSAHRRMAEIMLDEIGRPPGPEMDNSEDREGYSLACGFSLGLILLGMGNESLSGLDDLKLTDRLYKYINGGKKEEISPMAPSSFRIWEGNMINTNVSSIGAIVALGLTFLKTGNKNIARTLAAPHTEYLLEGVRPDLLLLRTLCYGLIMWEHILPTTHWINCQVPEVLIDCLEVLTGAAEDATETSLHAESAFPCTLTILAGACFALALRFAGTANKAAFRTIMFYLNRTHHISRNPTDFAGFSKDLTEMCLICLLLSASIVMAGTGNLELMRLIRRLRKRIAPVNTYGHNFVTYGCHMATHMCLGLLFLGGGRYTLKRDNLSVAVLFLSLYPIFQTCQDDNTYHLQAFRHLWVIAAQPRLLMTVDEDTNKPCNVPVTITTSPDCVPHDVTESPHDVTRTVFTPVMLPEFHTIKQFHVLGERYWPIVVSDIDTLKKGFIYVKKRTGYLEYPDDPEGKINWLGRTFGDKYTTTIVHTINTFSRDEKIILFAEKFCSAGDAGANSSFESVEFCKEQLLSCLVEEKAQYLSYYTSFYRVLCHVSDAPDTWVVQGWRIILAFYTSRKSGLLMTERLLSRLRYKLDELYGASLGETTQPTLVEVTRWCINKCHVTDGMDNFTSVAGQPHTNYQIISDVRELLSRKEPEETTLKFLELMTISGV